MCITNMDIKFQNDNKSVNYVIYLFFNVCIIDIIVWDITYYYSFKTEMLPNFSQFQLIH